MMVRFFKPRKSIFSRPRSSTACISNCVMMVSFSCGANWSGTRSISGSFAITVAQAWTDACRATPSRWRAVSISFFASGLRVVERFQFGDFFQAFIEPAFFHALRRVEGDELRDLVAERVGISHRASGIADRGARGHRSEGDDARDVILAIFFARVCQHFVAARVGESRCRYPASGYVRDSRSVQRAGRNAAGRCR